MPGSLRISEDGPEIPGDLIDSLLSGDVIFLCGTGVSAPQMPGFRDLVERTYRTLDVEKTRSEDHAFTQGRYEEVLGSLSRRLSDPDAVTRVISNLLAVPNDLNLDQHRTILRLSFNLDNQISLITTNFDTLFERAATCVVPGIAPRDISFAGQGLPAPGSSSFSGIIHIHGRLVDEDLGLERSPLVLTSADYGDAYMRSAWAARFLFDIARCRTIVLVGYSANDAPVRYCLSVLEADRERFPDLKPVYALDAYENNPEEATAAWGTLAVTPLPYCKVNPDSGRKDHSPLWRDLAALAEIAERPKRSRETRARDILELSVSATDVQARRELGWLLGEHHGLWRVVLSAITDPAWFNVFQDDRTWSEKDAIWVIAAWVAQDFESRTRFECALDWQRVFGRRLTDRVEQRFRLVESMNKTWTRVWRLYCSDETDQRQEHAYYRDRLRLSSQVVLDSDVLNAVRLIKPTVEMRVGYSAAAGSEKGDRPITKLRDIVGFRMVIRDRHEAKELMRALYKLPDRAWRIMELATAELQTALELEVELELIADEYDHNDFSIPSIEPHEQNRNHQGVLFLIRVLVGFMNLATAMDRQRAREFVDRWKRLPGRTGLRLCFHAMRNDMLFEDSEAIESLLSAKVVDFWIIHREIAVLIRERAGDACNDTVMKLEQRILHSGRQYYAQFPILSNEVDWRPHARDAKVWLRLEMLRQAGVLSAVGAAERAAIVERRDYLNRAVEDRDFFGSYTTGPRMIEGDASPIVEAVEDDRLRVAKDLLSSSDFELRDGWSAFCRSDPEGAFDSLIKGQPTAENGGLWNEFLHGLVRRGNIGEVIVAELTVRALAHLAGFELDALRPMTLGLVDVVRFGRVDDVADVDRWRRRLWKLVTLQLEESLDLRTDLYYRAMNSGAGKVVEAVIIAIDKRRREDGKVSNEEIQIIRTVVGHQGVNGQLGRAVIVRYLDFIMAIEREIAVNLVGSWIRQKSAEGRALRSVMLHYSTVTPEMSRVFKSEIMDGLVELDAESGDSNGAATMLLRAALAEIDGESRGHWGLNTADIAQVLRKAPQSLRIEVLSVLVSWLDRDEVCGEDEWCRSYGPFFARCWPKERVFRDVALTHEFIALAVGAGNGFPTALGQLRPYMLAFERGFGSLHSLSLSDVPEKFPRDTLELLWLVCGPSSQGEFYEIAEIIDRLIDAYPALEVDRRLQWLESHAERLG